MYIDQLYDLLKSKGWENSSEEELQKIVKSDPSIALHSISLVAANVYESLNLNSRRNSTTGKRNRETKRNHFFWRNKNRGIALKEIAKRWESSSEGYPVTENIVKQGIRNYKEKCGPLFNYRPTMEILNGYTEVLKSKQDAAHVVFNKGLETLLSQNN